MSVDFVVVVTLMINTVRRRWNQYEYFAMTMTTRTHSNCCCCQLNWTPPLLLLLRSGVAVVVVAFCMLLLLEGETIRAGVSLLDAAVGYFSDFLYLLM